VQVLEYHCTSTSTFVLVVLVLASTSTSTGKLQVLLTSHYSAAYITVLQVGVLPLPAGPLPQVAT
jgi:hypothetical protein